MMGHVVHLGEADTACVWRSVEHVKVRSTLKLDQGLH